MHLLFSFGFAPIHFQRSMHPANQPLHLFPNPKLPLNSLWGCRGLCHTPWQSKRAWTSPYPCCPSIVNLYTEGSFWCWTSEWLVWCASPGICPQRPRPLGTKETCCHSLSSALSVETMRPWTLNTCTCTFSVLSKQSWYYIFFVMFALNTQW